MNFIKQLIKAQDSVSSDEIPPSITSEGGSDNKK